MPSSTLRPLHVVTAFIIIRDILKAQSPSTTVGWPKTNNILKEPHYKNFHTALENVKKVFFKLNFNYFRKETVPLIRPLPPRTARIRHPS